MKKTLKRIAALCASVLLLSTSAIPAFAADSSSDSLLGSSVESYIFSQIGNAIYTVDGNVFIPGYGIITEAQYKELRDAYLEIYLNSVLKPTLPGFGVIPGYGIPGFGTDIAPTFKTESITLNQFQSTMLYFGSSYTFSSTDESIVTVNPSGVVFAAGAGEASIVVSNSLYVVAVIHVTVNPVDVDTTELEVRLDVSDSSLEVGESATVWAYLTKYNTFPYPGVFGGEIEITVSDDTILSLDGNTITALKEGYAYVYATLKNTELSDSVLITVAEDLEVVYPSYPFYPSYPSYPNIPNYPSFPSYPNYPFYPGYDVTYPWYGFEITVPGYDANSNINWAKILGVDTDVFTVTAKYGFIGGAWMRTFTLNPKDGTEVTDYTTEYKRIYVTGGWETVAIKTPVGYEADGTVKEEEKPVETPVLTPEEIEALKKAEEAAKKQAELKEKIALAMDGKLEWYEVYSDLYGDSYYTKAVEFALENQYVVGNEDGTFGASQKLTYGDVADVLCKFLTMTPDALAKAGIIDTKKADEQITREEFAVVLQKVAKKMGLKNNGTVDVSGYDDSDKLDSDKASAFGWALRNKLLNKNGSKINPEGAVDKARLCQVLYVLNNLSK
ncbi:MAG: S-layer homology domain-containing protein [Clostridia bacterium]|nr:S-layer homology domain-containing protein [Clostridia bacterium]